METNLLRESVKRGLNEEHAKTATDFGHLGKRNKKISYYIILYYIILYYIILYYIILYYINYNILYYIIFITL